MIAPSQTPPESTAKPRSYLLAVVLAILIALGIFQHVWKERSAQANDPAEVTARLKRIPLHIGSWEGQDETDSLPEYPPGVMGPIRTLRYVNRQSGEAVRILITAGSMGPILVNHRPMDCYPGVGYELTSGPSRQTISSQSSPGAFWICQFAKTDGPIPSFLRVYWSFSGSGEWQAPDSPRLAFARYPTIYKLYVIRALRKKDEPLEKDPAHEFIRQLIPELNKAVFAGQEGPSSEE